MEHISTVTARMADARETPPVLAEALKVAFKIERPGIYFDVPTDDYFADPAPAPSLTQSIAKILIDRSPAHAAAEHPRLAPAIAEEDDAPEKYDTAKAIGNAAHALMIGRGKSLAVGDYPSWVSKDAKAFKAEAMVCGLVPILSKHMARAEAMVKAARAQLDAVGWRSAFLEGAGEVMIAWQEDGLWFRSLIDWLVDPSHPYDLKTTGLSCAPHAVPTLMANAGWDIQAAMHERGLNALDPGGAGRRVFRFVAQENEPPFALTPVEITEGTLTLGRKKLAYAVDLWRRCMDAGEWPAYPTEVCRPEYPGWRETQWLDREVAESERRPQSSRMLTSLMGG